MHGGGQCEILSTPQANSACRIWPMSPSNCCHADFPATFFCFFFSCSFPVHPLDCCSARCPLIVGGVRFCASCSDPIPLPSHQIYHCMCIASDWKQNKQADKQTVAQPTQARWIPSIPFHPCKFSHSCRACMVNAPYRASRLVRLAYSRQRWGLVTWYVAGRTHSRL